MIIIPVVCISLLSYYYFPTLKKKYNDFQKLNELVATKYDRKLDIYLHSLDIVRKMYWINFLEWLNNNIEHKDKKTVIVSYTVHDNVYKFVSKLRPGPEKISHITDENNQEVSELVKPFMGPREDFHGQIFQPNFWGKDRLTFTFTDDTVFTFGKNDNIVFKAS